MSAPTSLISLADDFARTFEIVIADSDELRARVFHLRHRVFCEELGYELDTDGTLEADAYDAQSIHCLLRHRPSGLDTGCVRLVLPLASGGGLPFESYGLRYVDRKLFDWKKIDSRQCCEISRLAVASNFRRRSGEFNTPDGVVDIDNVIPTDSFMRTRFPFIAVSLYHAAIAFVLLRQYRWIFMVVAPRLQRHLQRYGVQVNQISPTFEHCGNRAVYMTTGEQFQREVYGWNDELQGLYSNVHQQLLGSLPQMSEQQKIS
jgi:N-acyl amino acid synthase of PEP-CTERM/exosortase system